MQVPLFHRVPQLLSLVWGAILGALARRRFYAAVLLIAVALGGTLAVKLLNSAVRIREEEKLLSIQPYRNGFVALSDIMRLSNLVLAPRSAAGTGPDWLAEVEGSVDILYVRKDTFRNEQLDGYAPEREAVAVAGLGDLVDFMDAQIGDGLGLDPGFDYPAFRLAYLALADRVRSDLILYLDQADHEQDTLLARRAGVIVEQAKRQAILAVGLLVVALVALMAMRAEALERRNRREAEARARYLAYYDPLTGLANRVSFQEGSAALHERAGDAAVFLLDLDNFKGINDTLGHAMGDEVLKATAARLERAVDGPGDIVARLGGDEFALYVIDRDLDGLTALGARIVTDCAEPIMVSGLRVNPGVSVGIAARATLPATEESSVETLMRLADYALYASKSAGRGCFTLSDPALIRRFADYRAIIEDLRDARAANRLDVYFQPKFRLAGNRLWGFEALVRWRRGGDMVRPESFIEIAEQNGMIKEIDLFVLEHAATLTARHNADTGANLAVAVNLSALNLNSDHILGITDEILDRSGLPPDLLTLEVSETAMIRNRGDAEAILSQLSARGIRVSVDDFGAGHASLVYVRSLRPDEIKIDRSLVRGIDTSSEARLVLDRMISVGLGLGMEVVTEGIETAAERDICEQMGASFGQGYLWGAPVQAETALARLEPESVDAPSGEGWTLPPAPPPAAGWSIP